MTKRQAGCLEALLIPTCFWWVTDPGTEWGFLRQCNEWSWTKKKNIYYQKRNKTSQETSKEKSCFPIVLCVRACRDTVGIILKTLESQILPSTVDINKTPTAKTSLHSLIKTKHKRLPLLHRNGNICLSELRGVTSSHRWLPVPPCGWIMAHRLCWQRLVTVSPGVHKCVCSWSLKAS